MKNMFLKTEITDNKEKFLIVGQKFPQLTTQLKKYLAKTNNEFFSSPRLPRELNQFDYILLINPHYTDLTTATNQSKKVIVLFVEEQKIIAKVVQAVKNDRLSNLKVIIIDNDHLNPDQIESIFWFAFSFTKERVLRIKSLKPLVHKTNPISFPKISFNLNKKRAIIASLIIFLIYNLLFGLSLAFSGLLNFKSLTNLYQNKRQSSRRYHFLAKKSSQLTNFLYVPLKPIYPFISLSLPVNNLLSLNENSQKLYEQVDSLQKTSQILIKLILEEGPTPAKTNLIKTIINQLTEKVTSLEKTVSLVREEIPKHPSVFANYAKKLAREETMITLTKNFLPHLDYFLGADKERKFLFLFANNMELRPGGGFIGSFAIIKTARYRLKEIKVYDVF